jgi:nucleoside-diphosphate-sugar epimerase
MAVIICILLIISSSSASFVDLSVSYDGQTNDSAQNSRTNVLVLGSGGFLGRSLVQELKKLQWMNVLEVKNRVHADLRVPGALSNLFGNTSIDYMILLACEVGGSKFLEADDAALQLNILQSNVQIYQSVLEFARVRDIPFLFTSSYLRFMEQGTYSAVKRLGEEWVQLLPHAHIVRLWNLYGPEEISLKSHVLADWAFACLQQGKIVSSTSSREHRQFMHVDDAAAAIVAVFRHRNIMPRVVDIASNQWTALEDVAAVLSDLAVRRGHAPCPLHSSDRDAPYRPQIPPSM